MTGLPKLALGTAVLTAERLFGRTSASSPFAVAVGLTDEAARMAQRLTKVRIKRPTLKVKQAIHDAGARGAITMSRSRRDAEAVLSKVMDRFWGGAVTEIRARVMPVLVDDLSKDPKVRGLIAEQSHTVISDAADELRETSADADDRLEKVFRGLFRVR